MSVKGGKITEINIESIKWGATESDATHIIDTTVGGDKTITVKVGSDMATLTAKEITNGQDLTGDSDFQGKKFIQEILTFRGDNTSPVLKNLVINASETLKSFLSNPKSHKIILCEMTVAEVISGYTAQGGYIPMEDSGFIKMEDTGYIPVE